MKFNRGQKCLYDQYLARVGTLISAIIYHEDRIWYKLNYIDAEQFVYMRTKFGEILATPTAIFFDDKRLEVYLLPLPDREYELKIRFYPHIEEI